MFLSHIREMRKMQLFNNSVHVLSIKNVSQFLLRIQLQQKFVTLNFRDWRDQTVFIAKVFCWN